MPAMIAAAQNQPPITPLLLQIVAAVRKLDCNICQRVRLVQRSPWLKS
jgi:hypothetical protein